MWNHRVIAKEYKGFNEVEMQFGIHEVYYNDDGIPEMCTVEPVAVACESMAGLVETLDWMRKCLRQPLLAYADFEEGGRYYGKGKDD